MALLLFLTLVDLAGTAGWVSTSQFRKDVGSVPLSTFQSRGGSINRLWSYPLDSLSTHGLGTGINYAWNPVVCEQTLKAKFSENSLWGINFADCNAILASMRRAFKSWSDNHPKLQFFDITSDCELHRQANNLTLGTRCEAAEIWVTTTPTTSGADAAATTIVSYRWAVNFVHTNGRQASAGVWEAVRAEIGFNTNNICWYASQRTLLHPSEGLSVTRGRHSTRHAHARSASKWSMLC